ncbi:MAG: oligogalacturonate lyase family protein [Pirellulaceae bacterium]
MPPFSRRRFLGTAMPAGLTVAAGSPWLWKSLLAGPFDSAGAHSRQTALKGRSPPERKTYKDRETGVEVVQLTNYEGDSHHFYFTNPGWYDDGRKLLFSSHRNKRTNLHGIDLTTGEIEQLTDLEPVPLPREVEFFRACKNPVREEAYFWHDLSLLAVDLVSKRVRHLHELEPGWCISMSNCSSDGNRVYFGTWEDLSDRIRTDLLRGYVGFKETFEARPQSKILEVAVDTGESRVVFEEKYWIGHVNTSPRQPNLLTFCHEGPWNLVDHRVWGLDVETGRVWKIRPTSGEETVGHEYWYSDGRRIGYHGRDAKGKPMIGRIRFDNEDRHETSLSGRTGHIFSHDERLIVGDGGGVIRLWQYDGREYSLPRVLCRHDSTMRIQQAHPHPRFSPDGKYVIFTSDCSGHCNVYKVNITEFERLPLADAG